MNGLYQVSNLGNVRSLNYRKSNKIKLLSFRYNTIGYVYVCLSKNGFHKYVSIHRLVANTFLKNKNHYLQVNHIDGNKLNNHVENLEWCNPIENMNHAFKTGLINFKKKRNRRKIFQYNSEGYFIKEWESINQASRECNIARSAILYCCQGKYKTSGGYVWRYAN